MLKTLRSRILLVLIGIVLFSSLTIIIFVQHETEKAILTARDETAKSFVNTIYYNIENQYRSIIFHKKTLMEERKNVLRHIIDINMNLVEEAYQKTVNNELNEAEAKKLVIRQIKKLRYDNGIGYIWINDIQRPYPRMIMHPTIPELDGKILDDPKFNCAYGRKKNLFQAIVDVCLENDSGYVDYFWPKPSKNGLTAELPKLSYVKLFKPWNWILGTGIYIDDIERAVKKRVDAVLDELNYTFSRIRVAESGYMYLFTGEYNMLIHPSLKGADFSKLPNPATGRNILIDLIEGSQTSEQRLDYYWDKPPHHRGQFTFLKRSYVLHFKPLDWYIASSVYFDEIKEPAKNLRIKIVYLSGIFFLIAVVLSVLLSKTVTKPLHKLAHAAKNIESKGYSEIKIPITGTDEIRYLGTVLATTLSSLENKNRESKQAEEKIKKFARTQEVLLREVNHRVKNNLMAIIGLLHKEQDRAVNEDNTSYLPVLQDLKGRIHGLSTVHSMLSFSGWRPLAISELCTKIIEGSINNYKNADKVMVTVNRSHVYVDSDQAHNLTLVINEMATNTMKHAFVNRDTVRIKVEITEKDNEVLITYSDDGPGFPQDIITENFENVSIGFELIRGIIRRNLRGKVSFCNQHGAVIEMSFKK